MKCHIVRGVLPREVAQAVNGSDDTRNSGIGSGDVGKELPRVEPVNVCPLGRTCPEHLTKLVPGCIFGDTIGSTIGLYAVPSTALPPFCVSSVLYGRDGVDLE